MIFSDKLLNYLVRRSYSIISPSDVIKTTKDGRILLGKEQISDIELKALKEEVRFIQGCHIWKIINETLKNDAIERSVTKSKDFDDVKSGKLMLVNLDVMNSILDIIKNKK